MAFEFTAEETVPESLTRCAREQHDRAIHQLTDEIRSEPAEAVHAARKAIKKERAVLRLARAALPRQERRRQNGMLREAARRVSASRDAEVVAQALEQLSARFAGQLPERAFHAARAQLQPERGETAGAAKELRSAEEAVELLQEARVRVDRLRFGGDGWDAIEPGLRRTFKRGRRTFTRELPELHRP